ncbi:MAG: hypothetical protein RLZZ436_1738 [Planctomycetota bacterium]
MVGRNQTRNWNSGAPLCSIRLGFTRPLQRRKSAVFGSDQRSGVIKWCSDLNVLVLRFCCTVLAAARCLIFAVRCRGTATRSPRFRCDFGKRHKSEITFPETGQSRGQSLHAAGLWGSGPHRGWVALRFGGCVCPRILQLAYSLQSLQSLQVANPGSVGLVEYGDSPCMWRV